MSHLIDAHARVLRTSAAIVARAGVADLDRRTPCAGWDLRALLAHMIGQNHGFASAVEGDGDPAVFDDRPVGDDPVGDYQASVDRVLTAFAAPGLAEAVPDAARNDDGRAPFRPTVPTSSTDLLDRVVANLGRDPQWTA